MEQGLLSFVLSVHRLSQNYQHPPTIDRIPILINTDAFFRTRLVLTPEASNGLFPVLQSNLWAPNTIVGIMNQLWSCGFVRVR